MNTVKATFVTGHAIVNDIRQEIYGVMLKDHPTLTDDAVHHEQIITQISYNDYEKLIKSNHPEYDFTPEIEITTPVVEQAEHPYKEELAKAFAGSVIMQTEQAKAFEVESLPPFASNVDEQTGEITEPQTKTEPVMETTTTVEQPVKERVSLGRKAKWYAANTVGLGVQTVTVPTHALLQTSSDILQKMANAVRDTEAYTLDKLRVNHTMSRVEIKGRIDQRTARIERVMAYPVTIPLGIAQAIRLSMKSPIVAPQPQTA